MVRRKEKKGENSFCLHGGTVDMKSGRISEPIAGMEKEDAEG
jgi:hypothetical protein